MDNILKVHFRIGEIEFRAEGSSCDVERERESFTETLLPLAIDAMVQTKGMIAKMEYIDSQEIQTLPPFESKNKSDDLKQNKMDLPSISVNEFIKSKGFLSKIDNAIGLIYYNELRNDKSNFSSDDLRGYFTIAKQTPPVNPSDIIYNLVKKAFIMETTDKGKYQITGAGKEYIENYIAKTSSRKKASSKRTKLKIKSPFKDLNIDTLNLKSYPEIKTQNSFKKRMILTLFIVATEGKGDAFSVADVQCLLTDKFGLPATKGQVQGVFDRNKNWFTSISDEGNKPKHKLISGAMDYAKSIIEQNVQG